MQRRRQQRSKAALPRQLALQQVHEASSGLHRRQAKVRQIQMHYLRRRQLRQQDSLSAHASHWLAVRCQELRSEGSAAAGCTGSEQAGSSAATAPYQSQMRSAQMRGTP